LEDFRIAVKAAAVKFYVEISKKISTGSEVSVREEKENCANSFNSHHHRQFILWIFELYEADFMYFFA
jgi:hypothetical protein